MKPNRREFIRSAGIAATAGLFPTIIPARVLGAEAPSKKITLGFIGMGGQGMGMNLATFLGLKDCHAVSVCDAFLGKAKRAARKVNEAYGNRDCKVFQDFREVLADDSLDAVVISTPDHWHVPMSLMALAAGKDVFCEKPTLTINDGQALVEAFAGRDVVFQAGIEDRSSVHFHKMVELVKNGAIGDLERVLVRMPAGVDCALEEPVAPPADLDWNLWQGPAAYSDYSKNCAGGWHWRNNSLYSKGAILDMGTHLMDTAQLGVNDPDVCPVEVSGTGEIPEGRLTDVPVKFNLDFTYGNGVVVNLKNGPKGYWDPDGCFLEYQGSKGWIRRKTWSGGLEASDREILRTKYEPGESKHCPRPPKEQRNFLDCVKSRRETTYPAIDLHQMSTTLHMGVLCIQLGRKLKWDPRKEEFLDDVEANRMRNRPEPRNWEAES